MATQAKLAEPEARPGRVTAYIIVSIHGGETQHGERFYADRADAEADAAYLARDAQRSPYYKGDPRGVPSYSVRDACTTPLSVRQGRRFAPKLERVA